MAVVLERLGEAAAAGAFRERADRLQAKRDLYRSAREDLGLFRR